MNILGTSNVSLQAAQAWAKARGGHQRYIDVAPIYWQLSPLFSIPPEIPFGQAGKETDKGKYTGVVGPERHNWCGLKKATGGGNYDPDAHMVFASDYDGVLAHLWHLYGYTGKKTADGPNLPNNDPRFHLITKYTQAVEGLGGGWAPSPTYGNELAKIVVDLRDFANNGVWEQEPTMPVTIPKPPMVSRPSPNRGGYSTPRIAEAIVDHIATGTIGSNLGWLTNPASGASCNYYLGKDGTIYELVPWQEAAWCNGKVSKPDTSNALIAKWVKNGWNPNTRTISIEHEGEARDTLTAAQIASNNALTAWLSQVAGIPISRATVLGHYQIDSVDRPYCPSFSDAEWRALVDGANALLNASQPQPEPAPPPQETITLNGHTITGGILQAWRRAGGTDASLGGPGLPTSDEIRGIEAERYGATAIQWFQRDRAEWRPGSWPDNHDVQWGLVANELRQLWRELEAA